MPDEKKQGDALNALGAAMKRWGVKPEQLKPPFRELMAFTPDEVPPMTDEPKPLTYEELAAWERWYGLIGPADVLRLVAEVRRLRELAGRMVRACECGGAAEQQSYNITDTGEKYPPDSE